MQNLQRLQAAYRSGAYDEQLLALYGCGPEEVPAYRSRIVSAMDAFRAFSPDSAEVALFSAPGRTEIGGNHTDHQHGIVLAASVQLDMLAVAAKKPGQGIRIRSDGYPAFEIDLNDLSVRQEERNSSRAIVRGIAARFAEEGCPVDGFDAYVTSNVGRGSGLSSSAAFEVLIATIVNHLYDGGRRGPVELAQFGQYAENVYFGKPSGLMDQTASAYGGLVMIDFAKPEQPAIRHLSFDFAAHGYALCMVDSGADHANLSDEYATIPGDLAAVCRFLKCEYLRDADEAEFYRLLPEIRRVAGDRAVLRAIHVFEENRRAVGEYEALQREDVDGFLQLVLASGRSSFMYLQNVVPGGNRRHQALAVTLALCDRALDGTGAFRVHGGGFAGTALVFVPRERLDGFRRFVNGALGREAVHPLSIRQTGGAPLPM